MIRTANVGSVKIYIYEESGNLHVRNNQGEYAPILYAAYICENEGLNLRDYMNLTGKTLQEESKELYDIGVVFMGNTFDISFYDEDTVDRFMKLIN